MGILQRTYEDVVEDRLAYFGSLEAWDLERDLEPLRTFLKAEAVRTWRMP